MELKTLILEKRERELAYLERQAVGSDEYNESLERLNEIDKQLIEIDKVEADADVKIKQIETDADIKLQQIESEANIKQQQVLIDQKDKKSKNRNEFIKIFGCGIALPVFGWAVVTAFEKDDSLSSSLKRIVNCFIPKSQL